MKKKLLLFSASLFAFASCNTQEVITTTSVGGGTTSSLLQISLDDQAVVRTGASSVQRFAVEAYSDAAHTTPAAIFVSDVDGEENTSSATTTTGELTMSLSTFDSYHLLLWADDNETYDATDLQAVTLASGKDVEDLTEAWHGTFSFSGNSEATYSVSLSRAVAKINLQETGTLYTPSLSVSFDAYGSFDVATGDVVGEATTYEASYTFDDYRAGSVTGLLNEDAPIYVFAPSATAAVMDLAFEDVDESFTLSNVPVQANYVTSLTGHYSALFASSFSFIRNTGDWLTNPDASEIIEFKCENFESAVLAALGKIKGEVVTANDALTISAFNCSNMNVTNMTGINYFTNLTSLDCSNNNLTSIDITALNKLTALYVNNNNSLAVLTMPENPSSITILYAHWTAIVELDITKCTALKTLFSYDNVALKSVNFRNCPNITTGNIARCYGLTSVYLNEGQTDTKSWVFKELANTYEICSFIFLQSKGEEITRYANEFTATWK